MSVVGRKHTGSGQGQSTERDLVSADDMAWRLADALRRVLYGADDGTTHPGRVAVAIEAVETYDRWRKKRTGL